MNLARPAIVSEEELLSLPETMDRVELLDGEVIVAPSQTARHQTLLVRLATALQAWADSRDNPGATEIPAGVERRTSNIDI